MPLTPVITEHWDDPELYTLAGYRRHGGYRALESALKQDPDALIAWSRTPACAAAAAPASPPA